MKKTYLILFLFSIASSFAQPQDNLREIATAEMRSASNLMAVVINPDTQNYDITYHKLEFNVDPTVYLISGKIMPLERHNCDYPEPIVDHRKQQQRFKYLYQNIKRKNAKKV
jgi:hypothetical protein